MEIARYVLPEEACIRIKHIKNQNGNYEDYADGKQNRKHADCAEAHAAENLHCVQVFGALLRKGFVFVDVSFFLLQKICIFLFERFNLIGLMIDCYKKLLILPDGFNAIKILKLAAR